MAQFLKLPVHKFMQKYIRRVGSRYSLIESKTTFDCVFLKDKKCEVYAARPIQCRTYPWWPQNLSSKEAWNKTAQACEGIDDQAELVQLKTIEEQKRIQIGRNADNS